MLKIEIAFFSSYITHTFNKMSVVYESELCKILSMVHNIKISGHRKLGLVKYFRTFLNNIKFTEEIILYK